MIVKLTWAEVQTAYHISSQRIVMNLSRKVAPRYGAPTGIKGEELDIIAVRGEMAVAKGLNLFWSGSVGDYTAVDVGGLVEVRTRTQSRHGLIVHPKDRDWAPYVLVDPRDMPDMWLVGWMFGGDAKNDKYWADPTGMNRPAYFVAEQDLRPMSELVELLRRNEIRNPNKE